MSLDLADLQAIRTIVREEVQVELRPLSKRVDILSGNIEALENDVKEIYFMLARNNKLPKNV